MKKGSFPQINGEYFSPQLLVQINREILQSAATVN
ncbi:hypothetical protein DIKCMJMK_04050 [Shewanella oneidensis]|nr:hypothetical protein [Shewanella oneidensis]